MARHLLTLALIAGVAGCGSLTDADVDEAICPQTYEFGNYGCARLVVLPGNVPANAPSPYRWKVSAEEEAGIGTSQNGTNPLPQQVPLQLTLWLPPPGPADTVTVKVVAQALDDSGPVVVGVPLPLFAIDSARYTVHFAAVGERPNVDTLRLDMRSVQGQ